MRQPPTVGTSISGRYELLNILFTRGLARVFLARDREGGSEVTVKHLHDEGDGRCRALLLREARLLSELAQRTSGVPAYHDLVHEPADVYLVTERVRGALLDAWQQGRPRGAILQVYARLASVLHEIHTAGFVHRDVKPTHVMVEDDDDSAAVKIIDLELAAKREELASLAGERIVGTPLYMSPEMIKGEQVAAASDVFALGVMLAEAMTGRWPWSAEGGVADIFRARLVASPALGAIDGSELGALVRSMLVPEPERRPSAQAVAHALAALAGTG